MLGTPHLSLLLGGPQGGSLLLCLSCIVSNEKIAEDVTLVHGPDLDGHTANASQVLQRCLIQEVVWVGDLLWCPNSLHACCKLSGHGHQHTVVAFMPSEM